MEDSERRDGEDENGEEREKSNSGRVSSLVRVF